MNGRRRKTERGERKGNLAAWKRIERGRGGIWTALVLLIEGSEFLFKNCAYLRCIQCDLVYMPLYAPKIDATFEGEFGTLN